MLDGFTLIVSWLKDIKKCQITESNWNVSSRIWELQNEETILEVLNSTNGFFYERFGYKSLINTTSPLQFLNDGEINVLGLEINSGTIANIYGVNTDFVGLSKKNNSVSIEEIIRNMLRTALLIYGFYNLEKGTIVYVSTNVSSSEVEHLLDVVKVINEIFKVFGFHFTFILYLNEDFSIHVQNPVTQLTKPVRNTPQVKFSIPTTAKEFISSGLNDYLQLLGYESIDKREKGGALWLIGGEDLEPLIDQISIEKKVKFSFSKKGSKSTAYRPAWFTKSPD